MTEAQYGYQRNVVLKFEMRDLRVYPLSRITSKSHFSLLISFLKCDVGAAARGVG